MYSSQYRYIPTELNRYDMYIYTFKKNVYVVKICIYSRANAPTGSAGEESVSSCWVAVAGFWWVLVVVVVDDVVDVVVVVVVDVVVDVDVDVVVVDVDVDVVVVMMMLLLLLRAARARARRTHP